MSMKNRKEEQTLQKSVNSKRRSFLKQVAYVAPTVVVLGALMKPTESEATSLGNPPSGPTWSH